MKVVFNIYICVCSIFYIYIYIYILYIYSWKRIAYLSMGDPVLYHAKLIFQVAPWSLAPCDLVPGGVDGHSSTPSGE